MAADDPGLGTVGLVAASLNVVTILLAGVIATRHRALSGVRWRVGLLIASTVTICAGVACAGATGPGWWDGLVLLAGITWFYALVEVVGPLSRPPPSARGDGDRR